MSAACSHHLIKAGQTERLFTEEQCGAADCCRLPSAPALQRRSPTLCRLHPADCPRLQHSSSPSARPTAPPPARLTAPPSARPTAPPHSLQPTSPRCLRSYPALPPHTIDATLNSFKFSRFCFQFGFIFILQHVRRVCFDFGAQCAVLRALQPQSRRRCGRGAVFHPGGVSQRGEERRPCSVSLQRHSARRENIRFKVSPPVGPRAERGPLRPSSYRRDPGFHSCPFSAACVFPSLSYTFLSFSTIKG